jgi:hypothetical protein
MDATKGYAQIDYPISRRLIGNKGPSLDSIIQQATDSYNAAAKIGEANIAFQFVWLEAPALASGAGGITSNFGSSIGRRTFNPEIPLLGEGEPPNAGGFIRSYVTSEDQTFFRASSSFQNNEGGFLTSSPPRSSAYARASLALPPENDASLIQEVYVPAGTRLQRSRALPLYGQPGGGEQFQLLDRLPASSFGLRNPFDRIIVPVFTP